MSERATPEQTLQAVRAVLPKQVFAKTWLKTLGAAAVAVAFAALAFAFSGWVWARHLIYLYPLAWLVTGTALTSCFILGHDCGHYTFSPSKTFDIVFGHLMILPSCYPFYAWKYLHESHHKQTNKLGGGIWKNNDVYEDTVWIPFTSDEYEDLRKARPLTVLFYRMTRAYLPLSVILHFKKFILDTGVYKPQHRRKVRRSILIQGLLSLGVAAAIVIGCKSWFALVHFWVLPTFVFSHWLTLYTYLHHTAEDMPVYSPDDWTPYKAQMHSTTNCLFPRWVSFLHFNIDVHVPHHVAMNIPCYNLRQANIAIKASAYGTELREVKLTWPYLVRHYSNCKIWDLSARRYHKFPAKSADAAFVEGNPTCVA